MFKFTRIASIIFIILFSISDIFAISYAERSKNDYILTLEAMRELDIIISNTSNQEDKNRYIQLKNQFKEATEAHYTQEYTPAPDGYTSEQTPATKSSVEKFKELKLGLIEFYDKLAASYLQRAKQILDSTSKESNDILIEYQKNGSQAKFFYTPVDPMTEPKPYKPEEYHFFRDKQRIERYLKDGYSNYHLAKKLNTDTEFNYIKSKKNKKDYEIEYIIKTDMQIIDCTRQAKELGIAIHKILRESQTDAILKKYDISDVELERYPIFDDRIPEDYKVDAIDNRKMIFEIEKGRAERKLKAAGK